MTSDGLDSWMAEGYPRAVAVVAAVCGNREVAEDCVAEAIVRALDQPDGAIRTLDAWIIRVAINRTHTVARRAALARRRATRPVGESPDHADGSAVAIEVLAAIRQLPTRQREVIAMHYYLDWPILEIADALERSPGSVKNALHKGRHTLQALLSDLSSSTIVEPGPEVVS